MATKKAGPVAGDHHRNRDLLDSLTSHLSLYHSSTYTSNPNSSPRAAILRWLSSLPPSSRAAASTVVSLDLARLLSSMLLRLRRLGHGFFFLLPDLPSTSSSASSSTSSPSLLFRRSRGLLSRSAASDPHALTLASSLLFFSSSSASSTSQLDAITISEALISDLDKFVATMDAITSGKFLVGDEEVAVVVSTGSEMDWPEMGWLKEMGYYSLEAYVANRIEVAIRTAWMASGGVGGSGKKGRVGKVAKGKGKERVEKTSGVAANAYWRVRGSVEWWDRLERWEREQVVDGFFGKAAKSLVIVACCTYYIVNLVSTYVYYGMELVNCRVV